MKVRTISEAYTSQTCPRCHSRHSVCVLRGFRCLDCGLEAHRDAVGVLDMLFIAAGTLLGQWFGLCFYPGIDSGWNRNNEMPTQAKRIIVEA